jgi:hypothetical protein
MADPPHLANDRLVNNAWRFAGALFPLMMETRMNNRIGLKAGFALAYIAGLLGSGLIADGITAAPANAAVYCKTVGVPKGCVVRPTAVRVVYCTRPGIPVGCRVRPVVRAPVVGVNTRWNRGGPVNRVGRR